MMIVIIKSSKTLMAYGYATISFMAMETITNTGKNKNSIGKCEKKSSKPFKP